jgi:hypothetical protein
VEASREINSPGLNPVVTKLDVPLASVWDSPELSHMGNWEGKSVHLSPSDLIFPLAPKTSTPCELDAFETEPSQSAAPRAYVGTFEPITPPQTGLGKLFESMCSLDDSPDSKSNLYGLDESSDSLDELLFDLVDKESYNNGLKVESQPITPVSSFGGAVPTTTPYKDMNKASVPSLEGGGEPLSPNKMEPSPENGPEKGLSPKILPFPEKIQTPTITKKTDPYCPRFEPPPVPVGELVHLMDQDTEPGYVLVHKVGPTDKSEPELTPDLPNTHLLTRSGSPSLVVPPPQILVSNRGP